ncbi:MAG: DNA translocase FtsK 4TM domain-containing protein [Chloroflexia bacterium]
MGKRRVIRKSRGNSSRSGRRRTTSRRTRRAQPLRLRIDPRTQRQILGLALLALAVLAFASFAVGGTSFYLFGWGGFFASLGLGALAVLILWGEFRGEPRLDWNDLLGGVLLLAAILGLFSLGTAGQEEIPEGSGGGVVGHFIAHTLAVDAHLTVFGAFFLLLIVGLIGAMLAFDISLPQAVRPFARLGRAVARLVQGAIHRPRMVIRLPGEEGRPSPPPPEAEKVEEEEVPLPRIIGRGEPRGTISAVTPVAGEWRLPPLDLLEQAGEAEISQAEIRRRARIIESTLASFNVQARVVEVNCGPTVTQFALQPGTGVKVAKITSLANDLALALAAPSIRIEAPVPGRPFVGIEIPNTAISLVTLREILESPTFQEHRGALKVALGRDVSGQPVVEDLTQMPHLLIAGTTGSGKSVCINAMVVSFLYQHSPDTLRFIMIDPKRVELSIFHDIPHLAFPVVTEINGRRAGASADEVDALKALYWATQEMERRYRVFSREGFRNITGYNKAARAEANPNLPPMPFIVIVIDELADLMMVAPEEVETMICRLAQLARATGIHLVLATQRPSVDVVTGLIKANFPSRISFAVSTSIDSRVVLDMAGAEQLLGRGDALYMAPDIAKPIRLQGSYVSDEEIERVVNFWKEQKPKESPPPSPVQLRMPLSWREEPEEEPEDELLPEAIALVRRHNRASAALLQRRLRVSYNRAARLIELLERKGIVGPEEQGRSREVLLPPEDE